MKRTIATNLKTEYSHEPLGIDTLRPRLSWTIQSTLRGFRQSAYRVVVSSDQQQLNNDNGDVWDSGKVASEQSVFVDYAGIPLQSGLPYYWKVKVWDQDDCPSAWSETSRWSMGLLLRSDWKAQWIGLKYESGDQGRPATYLRKLFHIDKPLRRAVVYVTALGIFELHLNGSRVGEDYLTPEWTDYNTRVHYRTYDVTCLLQPGDNAVASMVGDGWYCGSVGWFGLNQYGEFPRYLMQLQLEYEDGTEAVIMSDASWKASRGPILASDIMMGESYDARLVQDGWDYVGFDDSAWFTPEVFGDYQGWLNAQCSPAIQVTEYREPLSVTKQEPGHVIVDMGQNMVGWLQVSLQGNRGSTVSLQYAEILNPDGTLYTANLRKARQLDVYILRGGSEETYEPHFTFHGFRYVEISCSSADVAVLQVSGRVVHNAMSRTGTIVTSNVKVNQLYNNIVWTQRANFISVPTDCPQRDERLGWGGDAQIFSRTATYNMDVAGFLAKFTTDIRDAQRPTGAFTDTAPFIKGTPDWATLVASAGWAEAGIIIPWTMYRVYGDRKIITDQYEAMQRWIAYVKQMNPNLLRKDTQYFGDWLSLNADTPMDVFATAYFAYSIKLLAEMAEIIEKTADAAYYNELFLTTKERFNEAYVSPDGRIIGETQTVYAMALFMDLLPVEKRAFAAAHLVHDIVLRNGHISTGIHGIKYLLPVLCDFGYEDVAYRLLLEETYPSWIYSILQGATTIWERWDGWTEAKGFQDISMNSFNHYALGAVGEWMYRYLGGIDLSRDTPGFKEIVIRPFVGEGITHVDCEYQSSYGVIRSCWSIDSHSFKLSVTIPANTSAQIWIPVEEGKQLFEGKVSILASTDRSFAVNEISFLGIKEGRGIIQVGSGEYNFLVK